MAKGRSAKGKVPSDDKAKDVSTKVSASGAEPALVADGDEATDEIWDIVHMIGKDETICCRTDEREEAAVATWAMNLDPDDKWSLCEPCQDKEFGGWPESLGSSAKANAYVAPSANGTLEVTTNEEVLPEYPTITSASDIDDKVSTTKPQETPNEQDDKIQESANLETAPSEVNTNDGEAVDSSITNKRHTTTNMEVEHHVSQDMTGSVNEVETKETPTESSDPVDESNDDVEEMWDLKKILPHSQVTKECPIKCSNEDCRLTACCVWVSNLSTNKWYSCIDCQEIDFGGWPPEEELPVQALACDHIRSLVAKCSKQKSPVMPALAESFSPAKQIKSRLATNTVTPSPNSVNSGTGQQAISKGSKSTMTAIPSHPVKASAGALKKHREWQLAAEKVGGPNARIVVKKAEAKPLIFDLLYDAFRPMNITQIHNELMALVPSPVLKSCLDEMALDRNENPFDESDDEENAKPKAAKKSESSGDLHAGSLVFKAGRNANTCLYYVDHTKQKNNGDGLEADQRNALSGDFSKAQADEADLRVTFMRMSTETAQLLSEPTNEEAGTVLESKESAMGDVRDQLVAARKLKVNEKHKKQTKKRIDGMVAQWRKRKRLCMDFLITMEESTEGTVSVKKCLSGDGQIDIESDESTITGALAYGKKKRSRSGPPTKKMKVTKGLTDSSSRAQESKSLVGGLTADETFVAVKLDAVGSVCRVYLDADE